MLSLVFVCDWCSRSTQPRRGQTVDDLDSELPPGWERTDYLAELVIDAHTLANARLLCPKCAEQLRTDLRTALSRARLLSTQGATAKDLATPATLLLLVAELESAELAFEHAGLRDEKAEVYSARLSVSNAKRILAARGPEVAR